MRNQTGRRLELLLKEKNCSDERLAFMTRLPVHVIRQWLSNERLPNNSEIKEVAHALQMSEQELRMKLALIAA